MSVTFNAYNSEKQELVPEGFVQEWEQDPDYGRMRKNVNPWELNVANSNFVRLMDLLGSPSEDYCGQWESVGDELSEVLEQIKFVLQSIEAMPTLDGGVPDETVGSVTYCGLHEGYFAERLKQLQAIVEAAIKNNGTVVWS
jgi:hypothetical protein